MNFSSPHTSPLPVGQTRVLTISRIRPFFFLLLLLLFTLFCVFFFVLFTSPPRSKITPHLFPYKPERRPKTKIPISALLAP